MHYHGPLDDRAPRPATELSAPARTARLPWMNTLACVRRLCAVWVAVMAWLVFQPQPMRAQPETRRTAMKPVGDAGAPEPKVESSLPTGLTNSRNLEGPPPKMLVLHNGRIVEGKISQSAGGYMVEKPNGSLLVPFDRVSFEASDKSDAYRKFRTSLPANGNSNLALARWCLTYNLHDEAANELREALTRNPASNEARTMLQKLEELRNPSKPLHLETPKDGPKTEDGFQLPEVEALGGFSRQTAQDFIVRVQPILINKCGNASCHGGSSDKTEFTLSVVRNGRGHRLFAERNLAATMKFLDLDAPDRSPLLTEPRGTHGGAKTIFSGPRGGEQFETLRKWVRVAASEQSRNQGSEEARPTLASGGPRRPQGTARSVFPDAPPIVPATAFDDASVPQMPAPSKQAPTGSKPARSGIVQAGFEAEARDVSPKERSPKDQLKKTLKESQPDAFDPDEFNRRTKTAP